MIIACSEGGTSIEDLAEKYPDRIVKVAVKAGAALSDAQAAAVVKGLDVTTDKAAAAQQIKNLYKMFTESDCTLLEVNPLAETTDGRLIAADAKLNFDDNAAYRHPDIFAMRDFSQVRCLTAFLIKTLLRVDESESDFFFDIFSGGLS